MLPASADHLFWMSRYTERAENLARLLDASLQASRSEEAMSAGHDPWAGVLGATELGRDYERRYSTVNQHGVLQFMVLDEGNPSSIVSCLRSVQENARAVQGELTCELWETQRRTWAGLSQWLDHRGIENDPSGFFEWVKIRSHLSRGVAIGTMLKDMPFYFYRVGTFLERADNTARLIGMGFQPFHAGAMDGHVMDLTADQKHTLQLILRGASALEAYQKLYGEALNAENVAELLVLRPDMPRSLMACLHKVRHILGQLNGVPIHEARRGTGRLCSELEFGCVDEIMSSGLQAFLQPFLTRLNGIAADIGRMSWLPRAA